MKKVFVICPTYRSSTGFNSIRYFGIVSLLKQIREQDSACDIKVAIVDSSPKIHHFFEDHSNLNADDFLYFHIPDRNNISEEIKNNFKYAASFIPNENQIYNEDWQKIIKQNIAWDRFFPWEEGYPATNPIHDQIYNSRPTIGMKRNFAIASLEEKFGKVDYIVYADDDDIRGKSYIDSLTKGIEGYDFTRIFKYYTFVFDIRQWGEYSVTFENDINNNWLPSKNDKSIILKNNLKNSDYLATVG